jgi:hypothetical protein
MAAASRSMAAATSRATGGAAGQGETAVAEDEVEYSTGEGVLHRRIAGVSGCRSEGNNSDIRRRFKNLVKTGKIG